MGKLQSILQHPDEVLPLLQMALAARRAKQLPKQPSLAFCYDMLNQVSRSFAIVIQQLPEQLRDPVCIFYLVLRALDTIEDDMAIPQSTKVPLLKVFYEKIYDRSWKMSCGQGSYVRLMEHYPNVTDVFLGLDMSYQKVIADITRRMGAGMAEFIEKDVATVADYDLYCHYVAGLVGIGLSQLFASSKLESRQFASMENLSNHMGLFLQKTNIIRDYLEDIMEEPAPRMFWPKEIWGKYGKTLADFKEPGNKAAAVACLNHMVGDALRHAEHSLAYMSKLHDRQVFRFCAIPQVMAIGTLALCWNNHGVFTGVVKMRRGEVAKYMLSLDTMADLYQAFDHFAAIIAKRCETMRKPSDPVVKTTLGRVQHVRQLCKEGLAAGPRRPVQSPISWSSRLALLWVAVVYFAFTFGYGGYREALLGAAGAQTMPALDLLQKACATFTLAATIYMAFLGFKQSLPK
ncbi:hypothetical protein WJX72_009464 [[Myrmecia] bisecta]|uniref:Squalene synthase n=1 Tax=[Myrmecia] bisecta TaxID=41462 RepID=A0AAW1Q1K7_9CHLO